MKRRNRRLRVMSVPSRRGGRLLQPLRYLWGFTLLEAMIVLMVLGIIAAVAAPSFATLLDSVKVSQTVTELRTSFQDTQRQAIRKNQVCTVQIAKNSKHKKKTSQSLTGNCLTSGNTVFPEEVQLATNLKPVVPVNVPSVLPDFLGATEVKFGAQGSAEFSILSSVRPPLVPKDPTGKIVALIPDNPRVPKKCIAISSTLGLTRVGVYTGSTNPTEITDQGICTALDWKEQ